MFVRDIKPGYVFECEVLGNKIRFVKLDDRFTSNNTLNLVSWVPGFISGNTDVVMIGRVTVEETK